MERIKIDKKPHVEWWENLSNEDKDIYTRMQFGEKKSYKTLCEEQIKLLYEIT